MRFAPPATAPGLYRYQANMTTADNTQVFVSSPAAASSTQRFARRPGPRGVQLEDVLTAADEIVAKGQKPTIERVRQHLGGGSPNTVSPMLDVWFARLPQRLVGVAAPDTRPEVDGPPLAVLQAAEQFWDVARREAEQVQLQKCEADRCEIELAREALAREQGELRQREALFGQSRVQLEEALAASRQALASTQDQMHAQQQESARILGETQAEVRRLRKALEEALSSKEALREKSEMALAAAHRDAREAEERREANEQRHVANERRLLTELDRERLRSDRTAAELAKEQKAREAAGRTLEETRLALQAEKAARSDAASAWARQAQATLLELAMLRERAGAAEQRARSCFAAPAPASAGRARDGAATREPGGDGGRAAAARSERSSGCAEAPTRPSCARQEGI
jgi:hypothetical protein